MSYNKQNLFIHVQSKYTYIQIKFLKVLTYTTQLKSREVNREVCADLETNMCP